MIWKVEVRLLECFSNTTKVIETGEEMTTDIVLALAQVNARFVYEGVTYFGSKPTVDPIGRKITYWCEGYKDS